MGSTSWMRRAGISSSQSCLRFAGGPFAASIGGEEVKVRVEVRGLLMECNVVGRVRVVMAGCTKTR